MLNTEFPSHTCAVQCQGNLGLEGYSVDSCVNNGTDCGSAAADAFCNYLGTCQAPSTHVYVHTLLVCLACCKYFFCPAALLSWLTVAGLDGSAYENQFTVIMPATSPTHSMTGEWCIRNGTYAQLNDTSLQAIDSYKGPFCSRLDSVLCYRSRNSSAVILGAEEAKEKTLVAPAAAPSIAAVVGENIADSVPLAGVTPSPVLETIIANMSGPVAQSG